MPRRLSTMPFLLLILIAIGVAAVWYSAFGSSSNRTELDALIQPAGPILVDASTPANVHAHYVGSQTCAQCHAVETRQWESSDHAHSMMVANNKSVLGDFNHATFTYFGVTSHFFKKHGDFYVRTLGPDGKMHNYKVAYTFGIYPLQQYLVAFPGGRLQTLSLCWDARPKSQGGQRWFDIYPNTNVEPANPLFWTKPPQNWNMQCAQCHSTNVKKNYDAVKNVYHTTFSQINVSCESCHGPGSAHVAWAWKHQHDTTYKKTGNMGLLVHLRVKPYGFRHGDMNHLPERTRPLESHVLINICAKCHSRRSDLTDAPDLGHSLLQTHMPVLLDDPAYFPDGQIRGEDYVWGSFTQSVMYHHGVRCIDCHNPHTLKLRISAVNGAICLRCHSAARFATPSHTHHPVGSTGANCINCHMPHRVYMTIDTRFDHSIRIPRPDLSVKYQTPNACTQCHTDKTNVWAAKWVTKWYGSLKTTPQSFVSALAAGREDAPDAGKQLNAAARQKAYPAIARATAAELLQTHPSQETANTIKRLLQAPDPVVRLGAVRALSGFASRQRWQLGAKALRDKVLAVRITAAQELAQGSNQYAKGANAKTFSQALADLFQVQLHNADHAATLVAHGSVELNLDHLAKAKKAYQTAIARHPDFAAAYVNLADLYRMEKQEAKVQKVLHQGLSVIPHNGYLHYALALSDVRLNDRTGALKELRQAMAFAPSNTIFVYTYAIALNSYGQSDQAIDVLVNAIKQHPRNAQLLTTIVAIAQQQGDRKKAMTYAKRLCQLAPDNARYRQLLKSLQQK